MIRAVRSLVAALSILATVLTAGAVGAARGQAMAAGEIVICAGGAAVTIAVDADGNPTGTPHWCPDCVIHLLAGVTPVNNAAERPSDAMAHVLAGEAPRPRAASRPILPPARGPPAA